MAKTHSPQAQVNGWLQRAIVRLAAFVSVVGGDEALEHYSFLQPYLAGAREACPAAASLVELDHWGRAVARQQEVELQRGEFPLARLRQAGLTADHLGALMLISLVEIDARFGAMTSALHPFPDEPRMTVGLLDDLLRFNRPADAPPGWRVAHELEQRGLLVRHQPDRPRAAQPLSVPAPVWDVLSGETLLRVPAGLAFRSQRACDTLAGLDGLLPGELLTRLERLPQLVEQGLAQGVILRGMRGSGRLRALEAVARAEGRDVLHLRRPEAQTLPQLCRLAGPLAVLQRALPLIELELAPGETATLPSLAGYHGPVGIILNREGSVTGPLAERCVTLHVPAPGQAARQRQWATVLDTRANGTQAVVEAASRDYHLTLGAVAQAGQLARAYAALNGHRHVDMADVQDACRALNQQTLENLATRLTTDNAWADLIVSPAIRAELENLVLRCRHRERVLAQLGRGFAGTSRGVRALFGGPSGTGKTLAARLVAAELKLDLYRVDLAAVVSKYIGETERNLSRLFARAEEQDIVLLLDEGDSLLTARTEVRSSNDRYANLETNYLLQRLEQYEGIILITTNAADRIDGAFQRRIDLFIEFSVPDAGQRQQLWRLHLPAQHVVSQGFLRTAALRCQLTGGQIRNAALHATVLAVETETPVCDDFLADGIDREYTKIGAASPLN